MHWRHEQLPLDVMRCVEGSGAIELGIKIALLDRPRCFFLARLRISRHTGRSLLNFRAERRYRRYRRYLTLPFRCCSVVMRVEGAGVGSLLAKGVRP